MSNSLRGQPPEVVVLLQAFLVVSNITATAYLISPGALGIVALAFAAAILSAGTVWIPLIRVLGTKGTWIIVIVATAVNLFYGAKLYFKEEDPCVEFIAKEQIEPADLKDREVLILVSDFQRADDSPLVVEPGNYLYLRFEDLVTKYNNPGNPVRVEKLDSLLEDGDQAQTASDCLGAVLTVFGRVTSVDIHFYYFYTSRWNIRPPVTNGEWDLMLSEREIAVEYTLVGGDNEKALLVALDRYIDDDSTILAINFGWLMRGGDQVFGSNNP